MDIHISIGFFCRHFTERGTEVAIYDYAKYNEEILCNKSYIICFTEKKQQELNWPTTKASYSKFKERFEIIEIDDISEMKNIIANKSLTHFYTLTHGGADIYDFNNIDIWNNCKTIKHCVFNTKYQESDCYIGISDYLNKHYNTNIPVVPHIIHFSTNIFDNLRKKLNIPENAIILGRHGGNTTFNIKYVHECIKEILNDREDIYFLFLNTDKFYEHKQIIYLEKTTDENEKQKFINTCDAMIHGRLDGEIFSIAMGEFSIKNKPIITTKKGYLGHVHIMGNKAIWYNNKEELTQIFHNIERLIKSRSDWNAYKTYSPEKVMKIFKEICLD
tara:strand:- start:538 stop:1530 length:993 start_codon:yes stop_codon:yes gene_type:complete